MENTITNEQINEVNETIETALHDSNTKKMLDQAKEEASKDHTGEVGVATVVTNPFTGKPMSVMAEDDTNDDEFHLQTFEEMMEDDSIAPMEIDESKVKVTDDIIKEQVKITFGSQISLSLADIDTLMALANRVKNKEEFSYYNSMPQSIKTAIDQTLGAETSNKLGSFLREGRNFIASSLLQEMVNDATREVAYTDLQRSIAAIKGQGAKDMKNDKYWTDYRKYLMFGTIERADKLREDGKEDKALQYEKVHDAFIESYMMPDMLDMYSRGKLRIRKIDIEKFKKTCNTFNFKYQNTTNVINDIHSVLPILDRIVDKKYDLDTIKEFICAFIKYTDVKNMRANNIVDHTFMYNWIFNIISLDMYDREDEDAIKFHDQLINNINGFLQIITDRKTRKDDVNG